MSLSDTFKNLLIYKDYYDFSIYWCPNNTLKGQNYLLLAIEKNIHRLSRWMFTNMAFFYLNSFDAAFIEDERKVIFLIGILFLRSS